MPFNKKRILIYISKGTQNSVNMKFLISDSKFFLEENVQLKIRISFCPLKEKNMKLRFKCDYNCINNVVNYVLMI